MKKISIFMACLGIMAAGMTSCVQDTQPRIQKPTEFVLNTPPMAENTYVLSATNGIELSVSQANYGLGTVPTYYVEYSLDNENFKALPQSFTQARFTVSGEDISLALCNEMGYVDEDTYKADPVKLWLRVVSQIPNWDGGMIASNSVELKSVVPYFAVRLKDKMWIIGAFPGWDNTNDTAPLEETEVGSRIYQGTYFIPAGEFQLRFYDELGDWDGWSIGSQDADNPIVITFTEGKYTGPAFVGGAKDTPAYKQGKGAWQVDNWDGGTVKFTVDLSNPKKANVIFEIVE